MFANTNYSLLRAPIPALTRQLVLDHPIRGTPEEGTWGYSRSTTADGFHNLYRSLLKVVNETFMFAGFCYTQFADTFQEANGLLSADRTPKIPIEEIAKVTRQNRTYIPGGV